MCDIALPGTAQVPQHYCVFYVATTRAKGARVGPNEQEITVLIYVIIDALQNRIVGSKYYFVKPSFADANGNVLSEEEMPLEEALSQFDKFAQSLKISTDAFHLITHGQLPIRQHLHPEAFKKGFDLPGQYHRFHDLRKHFQLFYDVPKDQRLVTPADLLNYLQRPFNKDAICFERSKKTPDSHRSHFQKAGEIVAIVQMLIADGHSFVNPELVTIVLEPGVYSPGDVIDDNNVIRVIGFEWHYTNQDLANCFRGLNIARGGVTLCFPRGLRNGEALILFTDQEQRDIALERHGNYYGMRYIEVYKGEGDVFIHFATGRNYEAVEFLKCAPEVIVKMRGLPYKCTAGQVVTFFQTGRENSCNVMNRDQGVLFVKNLNGKPSGDAFVLFAKEEEAEKALTKNLNFIGERYVELFRVTAAEFQQVMNKIRKSQNVNTTTSSFLRSVQEPMRSIAPLLTSGMRQNITPPLQKDCIRLFGLPCQASIKDILKFLGEFARDIVYQGVHMVLDCQDQPSGEAFIQMESEHRALLAVRMKHNQIMEFGNERQCYIRVYQCTREGTVLAFSSALYPYSQTNRSLSNISPLIFPPSSPIYPNLNYFNPVNAHHIPQSHQDSMMLMNQMSAQQRSALNLNVHGQKLTSLHPSLIPLLNAQVATPQVRDLIPTVSHCDVDFRQPPVGLSTSTALSHVSDFTTYFQQPAPVVSPPTTYLSQPMSPVPYSTAYAQHTSPLPQAILPQLQLPLSMISHPLRSAMQSPTHLPPPPLRHQVSPTIIFPQVNQNSAAWSLPNVLANPTLLVSNMNQSNTKRHSGEAFTDMPFGDAKKRKKK